MARFYKGWRGGVGAPAGEKGPYYGLQLTSVVAFEFMSRATMSPYRPRTSAKMRMRIMPTKSLGCWAVPRTPASPTMPIANLVFFVRQIGVFFFVFVLLGGREGRRMG